MDSNAKLGPNIIPQDPHPQSANGKLLQKVICENNLKVVNGSSVCKGTITRERTTINGTEESILDHFIVCAEMFQYIMCLQIDQERKYCLTKFTDKTGSKTCSKESDHNTLILEINHEWNTDNAETKTRKEILNFKDKDNFEKFVEVTNDCKELRNFFIDPNDDLETTSKKWLQCIQLILKACFRKIRIKKGNLKPELQLLFQEKERLQSNIALLENESKFEDVEDLKYSLEKVCEKIAKICADKNSYDNIDKSMSCSNIGGRKHRNI